MNSLRWIRRSLLCTSCLALLVASPALAGSDDHHTTDHHGDTGGSYYGGIFDHHDGHETGDHHDGHGGGDAYGGYTGDHHHHGGGPGLPVPEPTGALLFGSALLVTRFATRRRRG